MVSSYYKLAILYKNPIAYHCPFPTLFTCLNSRPVLGNIIGDNS